MILEQSGSDTSTEMSVEGRKEGGVIVDMGSAKPHNKRPQTQAKIIRKNGPSTPRQQLKKSVKLGRNNSSPERVPRSSSTGRASRPSSTGRGPQRANRPKGTRSNHEVSRSPNKKQPKGRLRRRSPSPQQRMPRLEHPKSLVQDRTRTFTPPRARPTSSHQPLAEIPMVPISPNRQSAKFIMSPTVTSKRERPDVSESSMLERLQISLDDSNNESPSSPLRRSRRLSSSEKQRKEAARRKIEEEDEDDDDDHDEFAFELIGLYTKSPSKAQRPVPSTTCDKSVDSFMGRTAERDVSFWDLHDSWQDKPEETDDEEPFGPVVMPKKKSVSNDDNVTKTAPRRPGLFRSLSSLMTRSGGGGGGNHKSTKCSAASVGGDLTASVSMTPRNGGVGNGMIAEGKTKGSACDNSQHRMPQAKRQVHERSADTTARQRPSRSSSLTEGKQGKNMKPIDRHNSSASLPDIPMYLSGGESLMRPERCCVVLDIQRRPTGDPGENTAGYRVVHLVTDLVKMTVWDAVREAHRNFPENRLFNADPSLEGALQNGEKRGILIVGDGKEGKDHIEVRQSFDYWKKKDFNITVEALLPADKQRLSIQVEYADVLNAVDGEKDMFDRF